MRSKNKEIAATVTQKYFRIPHGRQLSQNETQLLGKDGIERKIYSPARQGQNKTSDSLSGNSHNNAPNNDAYNAEIF